MFAKRPPAARVATFCLAGIAAAAAALVGAPATPEGGPDADLEAALGAATSLAVVPGSVREVAPGESGSLSRAIRGREVLFLAAPAPGAPADLHLVVARSTPDGRLLGISGPVNLTGSLDGDDFRLALRFPFAAVATRVGGRVGALHVFHLDGQRPPRGEEWSRFQVGLSRLTDLLATGRLRGVGRVDLRFEDPPEDVGLRLERDGPVARLVVEWTDDAGRERRAAVDPRTGRTDGEGLEPMADRRLPKRPILWLVDTVRAVSWIGPGPIEWAEGRFFAARDRLRRLRYELAGDDDDGTAEGPAAEPSPTPRGYEVPPGLELGRVEPEVTWPPAPLEPPVFSRRKPGEGAWRPAVPEFAEEVMGRFLPGAPPSVYRTFLRTDRERPYVRVQLFAIDSRQLELHMAGGLEDPRSTTGARGTGRIPRDPGLLQRVVLAFNGAFKTEHGAYGMMVDDTVLLPPQDGAATVATFEGGLVAMGSWPAGAPVPDEMVSLRQNMDPLVEDGVVNPRKRYLWGFTLDEDITSMNTIRSGLCMTGDGTLIYAWGEDLTARTLGVAMNAAGCVYGMHLDMNPFHTALVHYAFPEDVDPERPRYEADLAIREMRYSPNRYVNGAPKDFFFMTVRRPGPGPGWSKAGLAQPAPAFVGAMFTKRPGACELLAVDLGRAALAGGDQGADDLLLAEISLGPSAPGDGTAPDAATLELDGAGDIAGEWLISSGELGPAAAGGAVVAIGRGPGNWLLAGAGPAAELARALIEAQVTDAICRKAPEAAPWVVLRRESAMTDFDGAAYREAISDDPVLRVVARPSHLGGRRLEVPADPHR